MHDQPMTFPPRHRSAGPAAATLQTEDAVGQLLSTGRIVADPARSWTAFPDAYAWMYRQMQSRVPTRGKGALWLWAKIGRRDLLSHCRRSLGKVLLTCRIQRGRVLLSEFDDWRRVLNGSPNILAHPCESDDAYSDRLNIVLDDFFDRVSAAGVNHEPVCTWPGLSSAGSSTDIRHRTGIQFAWGIDPDQRETPGKR